MLPKSPHILLLQPEQADSKEIYEVVKQATFLEFPEAIVETVNDLQNIYKIEVERIRDAISKADLIIGNMDGGNVSVTSNLSVALTKDKPLLLILRAGRASSTPTELMDFKQINFALKNTEKFIRNLRENIKEILEPEALASIRQLQFLIAQKESEWLDFKREFHNNKAKLLHDILCLSNSFHDGDRYLIFGVNDNKTIYGIEDDPNKKTNADLHDFLRQLPLNSIPKIDLSFQQFNEHEIGMLKIKDLPKKPYWLKREYRDKGATIRAGAIYTRLSDTNVPLNETAPEDNVEIMWRGRLDLLEKKQHILTEFQHIKNKILMNSLEPIIREELLKLQDFFQKYPGFLQSNNVSTFYDTFIKSREFHLYYGAALDFTQAEFADFRKQLFEIDLHSLVA